MDEPLGTPPRPRALRSDARRNRAQVLAAARGAFAEGGLETGMEDIAARAGVGVGTVYRHFETKEALLAAILVERYEQLVAEARGGEADEPWQGFVRLLQAGAAMQAGDRAFLEVSAALHLLPAAVEPVRGELLAIAARLVERAQAAGELRRDVSWDDLPMLFAGVGRAIQSGTAEPGAWRRYLAIILDGLHTR